MVRHWLVLAVIAAFAIALVAVFAPDRQSARIAARATATPKPKLPPDQVFRSRPDIRPPDMPTTGQAPAFVFLAPKRTPGQNGPTILDTRGRVVWFHPLPKGITADDFKVQTYRGKPVLTWWEGKFHKSGYGAGSWVVADDTYKEIARVRAGKGLQGDLHEIQLTDRGTALIAIYHQVERDLSEIGSFPDGQVLDSIVQEVDVESGDVLWEWHSLDHVGIGETYVNFPRKPSQVVDYFHINSIDEDDDGNLLISARNTWAVYKVDKRTGDVIWRLNGRRSDFAMAEGARFAWQHDARRQADGTITIFDNESMPKIGEASRLLTLNVDERNRRATVKRALTHPDKILAGAEGNAQLLDDGSVFTGWGLGRRVSQISPSGDVRFEVKLPANADTYRGFTSRWTGRPTEPPVAIAERRGDAVTAWASWNGATGVTRWELLAGASDDALRPIATAQATGFETAISAVTDEPYIAVRPNGGPTSAAIQVP
jgi:outer membrane protein assembly factor BamB